MLVVEDDRSLALVISASLHAHGYSPLQASSGKDAVEGAATREPDLIILDLGLPDADGLEVCRALRAITRTPILVVSADGSEERMVAALDLGADDYVTKPFSLPELMARVRVALRHRQVLTAVADDRVLECGPLVLDTGAHQARLGDRDLPLTRREFALLAVLMRNTGRVLPHDSILEAVWDRHQNPATVRTHVNQLRRKLQGHCESPEIRSEPGVGYRLLPKNDRDAGTS